jgi:hypothetical protein
MHRRQLGNYAAHFPEPRFAPDIDQQVGDARAQHCKLILRANRAARLVPELSELAFNHFYVERLL